VTSFAGTGPFTEKMAITTNGDFYEVCEEGVGVEGWQTAGKLEVKDQCLVITATNELPRIKSKLPSTGRERIIQADGHRMFLSAEPATYQFIWEKEAE
jgi:hypothetical protein